MEEGRKLKASVTERSHGHVSWIRFGEVSLRNLVGGIEICCKDSKSVLCSFDWKENGREYNLVCYENGTGRFLVVTIKDSEGKKFRVFIPEGNRLIKGWSLMVEKFRELGIVLLARSLLVLM